MNYSNCRGILERYSESLTSCDSNIRTYASDARIQARIWQEAGADLTSTMLLGFSQESDGMEDF